jgi:predicted membrane metal-binding protein
MLILEVEKQPPFWFDICGFNFAIVAGLFVGFFGWLLGRWRGMMAAFWGRMPQGIALYAVLAGASAGVVRAAIMGGLGVFAAQVGWRQYGLNRLAFVLVLLLADSGYAPINSAE